MSWGLLIASRFQDDRRKLLTGVGQIQWSASVIALTFITTAWMMLIHALIKTWPLSCLS
jgi:hypothetical protein